MGYGLYLLLSYRNDIYIYIILIMCRIDMSDIVFVRLSLSMNVMFYEKMNVESITIQTCL